MKKYYFIFNEGSVVNQVMCAILINIPVFAYGTCIGWMSPMTLLLQSENSPRGTPLSDFEISWMAAVPYLVCVPVNFAVAYLGDKIGRKIIVLFLSAVCVGCWVIKLSSFGTWAFILARALVGMIMAGAYVNCPMYTKEISQDHIRGFLSSLVILFHTSGNLLLYILGDILSYNTVLWICLAIPAVHLVLFMMMPESPSYLVKTGQTEEAIRVIAWLRCRDESDPMVQKELNDIKKEQITDEESSKFAIKAIFKDKILTRAFWISMMLVLAREICGAVPVLNFAGDIFAMASKDTGLVLTPNQQAMMLGAVQVAGSALASGVVEKTGRKPLFTITSLISGLSMCTLASWFLARYYDVHAPAWIPIVTLCLCIFCDASGLQPISVVVLVEIFSFKYRATVIGVTMAGASSVSFLQMLFFKPLTNAVGIHASFYFFGIFCIFAALYVLFRVPETKKRSLEEIYDSLKTKKERLLERNCEKNSEIARAKDKTDATA